jgi:SAM-dependent methyltransferase
MTEPIAAQASERHLDLGCGTRPRNPYGRRQLYGIDLRRLESDSRFEFATANLTFEPIPFPAAMFSSVSAFDFLEHVPRVVNNTAPGTTRFPFVELMTEVWRVLAPGGLFYALTPCYPHPAAFQDPTHVNIITEKTHEYFCGPEPEARMYGFDGTFSLRRARWVIPEHSHVAAPLTLKQSIARWRRERRGKLAYFLWELEAVKPAAGTAAR